jgi:hypothetical protein
VIGGALAVLAVLAVPVVWVAVLLVSDARHNRRIRAQPNRTVAGIRRRLELERAEAEATNAPTEVLPAIQPASADEPTVPLRPVLPMRTRPYAKRSAPNHRPPPPRPPADLMACVLDGLRNLPERPPPLPSWPPADPDAKSPPARASGG